jgi:hypothetical protein
MRRTIIPDASGIKRRQALIMGEYYSLLYCGSCNEKLGCKDCIFRTLFPSHHLIHFRLSFFFFHSFHRMVFIPHKAGVKEGASYVYQTAFE